MKDFGVPAQIKLRQSSVLVVGAGGLGSPVVLYLAGAGVGTLGIADFDTVDISNLHRQVLHRCQDAGKSKAWSAHRAVSELNPDVECIVHNDKLNRENALRIVRQYDLIVDATDNRGTRYLINDACVLTQRPLVSGSALGLEGSVTVYNYKGGPCLRCVSPTPSPDLPPEAANCSESGVLGVVPGILGCLQALEALKVLSGLGNVLSQRQCYFDSFDSTFREFKVRVPFSRLFVDTDLH